MRNLVVFNSVSLDGFFTGAGGDLSWAHRPDAEWNSFMSDNASSSGEFIFGRVTYDLMANYWPTPIAHQNFPAVAKAMNDLPKAVFSRTLEKAPWKNTKLVKGDLATEIKKMKQAPGPGLVIFGSGTIISQLAQENLIDEYQIAVCPVVIGKGRTMFETVERKLNFKLTKTRTFENGTVFACYQPIP